MAGRHRVCLGLTALIRTEARARNMAQGIYKVLDSITSTWKNTQTNPKTKIKVSRAIDIGVYSQEKCVEQKTRK